MDIRHLPCSAYCKDDGIAPPERARTAIVSSVIVVMLEPELRVAT
jgi:hypothetical protein